MIPGGQTPTPKITLSRNEDVTTWGFYFNENKAVNVSDINLMCGGKGGKKKRKEKKKMLMQGR